MGSVGQVERSSPPPWRAEDLKKLPRMLLGQSIKAWVTEMKRKKKEESRLEKADLHAATSVAGVATALAVVAAESARKVSDYEPRRRKLQEEKEDEDQDGGRARDAAMASAAALVATQCVEAARSMGAKKDQLGLAIESALAVKDAGGLVILTAAAAT